MRLTKAHIGCHVRRGKPGEARYIEGIVRDVSPGDQLIFSKIIAPPGKALAGWAAGEQFGSWELVKRPPIEPYARVVRLAEQLNGGA